MDEDLLELSFEVMKDILPGNDAKVFVRRSKLWTLIKNYQVIQF